MKRLLIAFYCLFCLLCPSFCQDTTDVVRTRYCQIECYNKDNIFYYVVYDTGVNDLTGKFGIYNNARERVPFYTLVSAIDPMVEKGWKVVSENMIGLNVFFLMTKDCSKADMKKDLHDIASKY